MVSWSIDLLDYQLILHKVDPVFGDALASNMYVLTVVERRR